MHLFNRNNQVWRVGHFMHSAVLGCQALKVDYKNQGGVTTLFLCGALFIFAPIAKKTAYYADFIFCKQNLPVETFMKFCSKANMCFDIICPQLGNWYSSVYYDIRDASFCRIKKACNFCAVSNKLQTWPQTGVNFFMCTHPISQIFCFCDFSCTICTSFDCHRM